MRTIVGHCLIGLRVWTLMVSVVQRQDGSSFGIVYLYMLKGGWLWPLLTAKESQQLPPWLAAKQQAWNQVLCDDSRLPPMKDSDCANS